MTSVKNSKAEKAGICFLLEDFYPVKHGATTQIMLLGKRLVELERKVIVITRRILSDHPKQEMINGFMVYRVPPVCNLSRFGKYYMLIPGFLALIQKRNEYQIILVSDFKVLGILGVFVSRLLGKRCILRAASCGEMDGTYVFGKDDSISHVKWFIVKLLVFFRNVILKEADGFLSISSHITKELVKSGVSLNRIMEISNGIDTKIFKPVSLAEKETIRKNLNLPAAVIFTFSGRLCKGKGLHRLIKVWGKVAKNYSYAHLLMVGSGQGYSESCEDELKDSVRKNNLDNEISFTGDVDNVYEYLQASDCFIFPTEYEALGNCLLEAISCGLPCIATRVGGIVDIINHNVNGLLVENGDEEQLYSAIEHVLKDRKLAQRLGLEARKTAIEKFNIDKNIQVLDRTFFSSIEQRASSKC